MAKIKAKTITKVKGKIVASSGGGKQGKPLYRSKAKLNTHIKNERPS